LNEKTVDLFVTLEQFQDAKTGLDMARSQLEIAEFNFNHSKILAPTSGIVLKQLAKAGEMIAPGHPVFIFGNKEKSWRVTCGVIDREVVRLAKSDSADIIFDVYPDTLSIRNPIEAPYAIKVLDANV
jgi:multidrug resistance efflux pump